MSSTNRDRLFVRDGRQATRRGDFDGARKAYREALRINPANEAALAALGQIDEREELSDQIARATAAGDEQFQQQSYQEALAHYGEAVRQAVEADLLVLHTDLDARLQQARDMAWAQERLAALELAPGGGGQQAEHTLVELLRLRGELPDLQRYEPLARRIALALGEQLKAMSEHVIDERLAATFVAEDFEMVGLIAERIASAQRLPAVAEARRTLSLLEAYCHEAMALAEEGSFEQALRQLAPLRAQYPRSPVWRRRWLAITLSWGDALRASGLVALARGEAETARQEVRTALGVYERLLEFVSETSPFRSRHAEAMLLGQAALSVERAVGRYGAGEGDLALSDLGELVDQVERACASGHEHTVLAGLLVGEMHQLQAEQERILLDQQRLVEAERALQARDWSQAEVLLRALLDSPLPDLQQQAEEQLGFALEQAGRARAGLEQMDLGTEPRQLLEQAATVYELAPHDQTVRQRYLAAILRLADSLGRGPAASAELGALLSIAETLDRDDRQVSALREELELATWAAGQLQDIDQTIDDLVRRQGARDPRQLDHLLAQLTELEPRLVAHPEQQSEVAVRRAALAERRQRWAAAAEAEERSLRLWQEAGSAHAAQALAGLPELLGPDAPPDLEARIAAWESALARGEGQAAHAEELLRAAQASYVARRLQETLDRVGEGLQAVRVAATALAEARTPVGGHTPFGAEDRLHTALSDAEQELSELGDRARVALEAGGGADPELNRSRVQNLLERVQARGQDDPVLAGLVVELTERLAARAPELILKAQDEERAGRYTDALALVAEAHRLLDGGPKGHQTELLRQHIRSMQELHAWVLSKDVQANAMVGTNSLMGALDIWRELVDRLTQPGEPVPEPARTALVRLKDLTGDRGAGLLEPSRWQEAVEARDELRRSAPDSRLVATIGEIVSRWQISARAFAQRGMITSLADIGKHDEAYRAAQAYMQERPTDPEAIDLFRTQGQKLYTTLREAAEKRLDRAQGFLSQGAPDSAHTDLQSFAHDIIRLANDAGSDFLAIFDLDGTLGALRLKAGQLQQEAARQRQLRSDLEQALHEAEELLYTDQIEQAEQRLDAAGAAASFPDLARRSADLRASIDRRRNTKAREQLTQLYGQAETTLGIASTPDEVEASLLALKTFRESPLWILLSPQEQANCQELRDKLFKLREQVRRTARAIELAREARATDPQRSIALYQQVLESVRDGMQQVELQTELEQVRNRLELQERQRTSLDAARAALAAGDHGAARTALYTAPSPSDERTELEQALRAAEMLASAAATWERGQRAEPALAFIEQARPYAEALGNGWLYAARLVALREQIEHEAERLKEWAVLLAALNSAVRLDDLKEAERILDALSERHSGAPQLGEARRLVENLRRNHALLTDVASAQKAGRLAEAQSLLDDLLRVAPEYLPALKARAQLQVAMQVQSAVARADAAAAQQRFDEARRELIVARTFDPENPLVREGEAQLRESELVWRNQILEPVLEHQALGAYPEALRLLEQALERQLTDGLRAELLTMQAELRRAWLGRRLTDLEQQAETDPTLVADHEWEDLGDLEAQASAAGYPDLARRATQLLSALKQHQHEARRLARFAETETLLATARDELEGATGPENYRRARRALEQAAPLADEVQRGELEQLRDEVKREEDRFGATAAALQQANVQLSEGQYGPAQASLDVVRHGVARQFRDAYDHKQRLLRLLREAESAEQGGQFERALVRYREAARLDEAAALQIRPRLSACEEQVIKTLPGELRAGLGGAAAGLRAVEEQLRAVRERELLPGPLLDRLDAELRSRQQLLAIGERVATSADPGVLLAVAEAAPAGIDPELDEVRASIMLLNEASRLLEAGQLDQAAVSLAELRPPLAASLAARALQGRLAEAQQIRAEVRKLAQHIETLLAAVPPDFVAATEALLRLRDSLPDDRPVAPLVAALRARGERLLVAALADDDYQLALSHAAQLAALAPDEVAPREQLRQIAALRDQAWSQALDHADRAIEELDLPGAQAAIERALRISGAKTPADPRVGERVQRLAHAEQLFQAVRQRLDAARSRLEERDYADAIAEVVEARRQAPGHRPAAELLGQIAGRLVGESERAVAAGHLVLALEMFTLRHTIAPTPELKGRIDELTAAIRARGRQLHSEARASLDSWRLEGARARLKERQELRAGLERARFADLAVPETEDGLADDLADAERAAPQIVQAMAAAWELLTAAEYVAAAQAFRATLDEVPTLAEAESWAIYSDLLGRAGEAAGLDGRQDGPRAAVSASAFRQAAAFASRAAATLEYDSEAKLPTILGGSQALAALRAEANARARTLAAAAAALGECWQRHQEASEQRKFTLAETELRQFLEQYDQLTIAYRASPLTRPALARVSRGEREMPRTELQRATVESGRALDQEAERL